MLCTLVKKTVEHSENVDDLNVLFCCRSGFEHSEINIYHCLIFLSIFLPPLDAVRVQHSQPIDFPSTSTATTNQGSSPRHTSDTSLTTSGGNDSALTTMKRRNSTSDLASCGGECWGRGYVPRVELKFEIES